MRNEIEMQRYIKSELKLIRDEFREHSHDQDHQRLEAKMDLILDLFYMTVGGDPKELG